MRRFDFAAAPVQIDAGDPQGFRTGYAELDAAIGAEHLGGTLFEVPPGERSCPYHWEAAKEEWLLVLTGQPHVRTPEGERQLRAGDLVCFPTGPRGAHQVINRSPAPSRIVMFSNAADPNVIVYVDSNKVGVRGRLGLPGGANYDLTAPLDYWHGET